MPTTPTQAWVPTEIISAELPAERHAIELEIPANSVNHLLIVFQINLISIELLRSEQLDREREKDGARSYYHVINVSDADHTRKNNQKKANSNRSESLPQ